MDIPAWKPFFVHIANLTVRQTDLPKSMIVASLWSVPALLIHTGHDDPYMFTGKGQIAR